MHLKWSAVFVWNKTPSENRTIHMLPTELPSKKSIWKQVRLPWRAYKSRVYVILRSNNPYFFFFLYFPSTEVDDSSGERQIQHIPKGTHGKHWIKLGRAVGVRTRPRGSAGLPLSLRELRAHTATSHLHISVWLFFLSASTMQRIYAHPTAVNQPALIPTSGGEYRCVLRPGVLSVRRCVCVCEGDYWVRDCVVEQCAEPT